MTSEFENEQELTNADFEQLNETFEQAQPRADDSSPDDDEYVVQVTRAYPTRAQSSGAPMIKWELEIVSGMNTGSKFKGRKLFRNNMLASAQNMVWLKTDFQRSGISCSKATELPAACKQLTGRYLRVQKKLAKDGKNHNVYINKLLTAEQVRAELADSMPSTASAATLTEFAPLKETTPAGAPKADNVPF